MLLFFLSTTWFFWLVLQIKYNVHIWSYSLYSLVKSGENVCMSVLVSFIAKCWNILWNVRLEKKTKKKQARIETRLRGSSSAEEMAIYQILKVSYDSRWLHPDQTSNSEQDLARSCIFSLCLCTLLHSYYALWWIHNMYIEMKCLYKT